VVILQKAVFKKVYSNRSLYERELNGYLFTNKYWQNAPKLLSSTDDAGIFSLVYEDIRLNEAKPQLITDLLACNIPVQNWDEILSLYLNVTKNYSKRKKAGGGTQLFYLDRLGNLNQQLHDDYKRICSSGGSYVVNGKTVILSEDLINNVLKNVSGLTNGLCIPSQGDFHERNIFSDGTVIDFEGAGWNLLATDIATFLWHSFFAGNHFGPSYATWSTAQDKNKHSNEEQQVYINNQNVNVELSSARHKMINDYVDKYLLNINLDSNDAQAVSAAIAFRLLSMFSVPKMKLLDRKIVYILANYFLQYPLFDAVDKLLY